MIDQQLKQKIVNTISKYEEKCDKLQVEINTLKSVMSKLLALPAGIHVDIDKQLCELQQDLNNDQGVQSIQQHVELLITTMSALKQKKTPTEPDQNHIDRVLDESIQLVVSQDVNQSLMQLLDHLAIPAELTSKVNELESLLHQSITGDLLPRLIDSITALVVDAFSLEQNQFKLFLRDLTTQLHDFDSYLIFVTQKNLESQQDTHQLESGIQTSICEIKNHVDNSTTIDELSNKINQNLATIGDRIKEYKINEEHRFAEYEGKIKQLQEKLMESERNAEEIKNMLSCQQVKINQDSLTGLPNRAAYDEHILKAYQRWQRGFGDLTLAVADIDHFKTINDNYGHLAGDKVLKKITAIFKNSIRTIDFVARYGGEEFIFIFERTNGENAKKILESLRKSVEECQFSYRDNKVDVTVSFGLTTLLPDEDSETLFMRADAAMYQAKRDGRNRVILL